MPDQKCIKNPLTYAIFFVAFLILGFVISVILVDIIVVDSSKAQLTRLEQENINLKTELKLTMTVSKYQNNIDIKLIRLEEEALNRNKEVRTLTEQLIINQNYNNKLLQKFKALEQESYKLKKENADLIQQLEIEGTKK
ncbi:hypothetical protein MT391_06115 [Vibrio sp. 1-Bac 57]